MPAALEVDHEKVKMVALVVGVREAARQFELPEDTVRQWSCREKWFAHLDLQDKAVALKIEKQGLSPAVTKTPGDVMVNLNGKSKLLSAKVGHSMLKTISKKRGDEQLREAQAYKTTVDALSKTHGGWEQTQTSQPLVNINLMGLSVPEVQVKP